MILNHGVNVLQIAAQVVELLPPGISNAFPGLPAALGESVVLLLCCNAIGSGLPAVCQPCRVKRIYDSFGVQTRFVKQRCIRWKTNRLRHTRRVQNQGAFVRPVRLFCLFRLAVLAAASCGTLA